MKLLKSSRFTTKEPRFSNSDQIVQSYPINLKSLPITILLNTPPPPKRTILYTKVREPFEQWFSHFLPPTKIFTKKANNFAHLSLPKAQACTAKSSSLRC